MILIPLALCGSWIGCPHHGMSLNFVYAFRRTDYFWFACLQVKAFNSIVVETTINSFLG